MPGVGRMLGSKLPLSSRSVCAGVKDSAVIDLEASCFEATLSARPKIVSCHVLPVLSSSAYSLNRFQNVQKREAIAVARLQALPMTEVTGADEHDGGNVWACGTSGSQMMGWEIPKMSWEDSGKASEGTG
jgi:hypothetical protein